MGACVRARPLSWARPASAAQAMRTYENGVVKVSFPLLPLCVLREGADCVGIGAGAG